MNVQSQLKSWLSTPFRTSRSRPRFLLSSKRFASLLERERQRAERSGTALALLVLTPVEGADGPRQVARLARVLKKRLRLTDDAGHMSGERIGVLLPDASAFGAWIVARDVCELCREYFEPPHCEVYVHPFGEPQPASDRPDDAEQQGSPPRESEPSVPIQAMQAILAKPLPFWKRALDVAGAATGLAVTAPLLAATAVAIKLTSPGPVLFQQTRTGMGGQPFEIFKFRTMVDGADASQADLSRASVQDGPAFKMKEDPRVTTLGNWLRKTSIDELPQLWNILVGDMSLVGPRPLPCRESDACEAWQRGRLDVSPGLTCIWQVFGRSNVTFEEWMRMDLQYIRQRSLWTDLKLIAATVPAVFFGRGAS